MAAACSGSFAQDLKVALVDMKRVFSEYHKTQAAELTVNKDKETAKLALDERSAKYKSLVETFRELSAELRDAALSEEVRDAKTKETANVASEAKSLEREIAELGERCERQLQETVLRLRQGILEEISAAAQKRAREGAYDLVFDKSGLSMNGVNFLLHSKDAVDISDELIAELNRGVPAAERAGAASPKQ